MLTLKDYEEASKFVTYKDGELISKNKQYVGSHGYQVLYINGKAFLVHRLVWFLVHKEVPKIVDHINGNKADNRVENLQNCCQSTNISKSALFKTNKTGHRGVHFNVNANKYEAYFTKRYKKRSLGLYDDPELAALVVAEAKDKLSRIEYLGRKYGE